MSSADLPKVPDWILELSRGEDKKSAPPLPAKIPNHTRNSTLASFAGSMRNKGMEETEILAALMVVNKERCNPPLGAEEVEKIAHSIAQYPIAKTVVLDTKSKIEHFSDLGNTVRLVRGHGDNIKFCYHFNKWFHWTGERWHKDESGQIELLAKETVRNISKEAESIDDQDKRLKLFRHCISSEQAARIRAMILLAQSEPGIPVMPDEMDQNPWVLNLKNGTYDIRSGLMRAHNRKDMITMLAPVEYDPDAKAPTWDKFLDRIFEGDDEVIDFMQRVVGYSLTGSTREQVMFILYGSGENGKSTFLETIRALLGDYAQQTPTDTLMVSKNERIPNDVARLKGARFVSAVEAGDGRRLAESLVKQMTGGDRIAARFMRGEWFEFKPEFKLFLGTNHKPRIWGTDHAIWRRIRLIPFDVRIPKEEQDKELTTKLRRELPGILAWAIEGCRQWLRDGLGTPDLVHQATLEYREEMDVIGEFLADHCVEESTATVPLKDIYEEYVRWCEVNKEKPLGKKKFGEKMMDRNYSVKRGSKGVRMWQGVRLRNRLLDGALTEWSG